MDIIKKQIKSNINDFTFNQKIIDRMYFEIKNNNKLISNASIITIKNNKIQIDYLCSREQKRTNDIIKLIEKSIKYMNNKNINYPDTTLFLYISDVYYYENQDLPFIIIAKPKNKKGILIPDNTFECHNNLNHECESWNEVVNKCTKNNVKLVDKKNKLFFIGANTGLGKQNIRDNLHKLSKTNYNIPLHIELNKRIDLCDFTKYKYLLNLPGNQPWSYRFKYLFLMKSLVINIDVRQKYKGSSSFNDKWINFFDCLFEENKDYINIIYNWKENDDKYNKYQYNKLVNTLIKTYRYYETDANKYKSIVKSGYNKSKKITDNLINESIYYIVYNYSKKINKYIKN